MESHPERITPNQMKWKQLFHLLAISLEWSKTFSKQCEKHQCHLFSCACKWKYGCVVRLNATQAAQNMQCTRKMNELLMPTTFKILGKLRRLFDRSLETIFYSQMDRHRLYYIYSCQKWKKKKFKSILRWNDLRTALPLKCD